MRRSRSSGFTLVELAVVLSVAAVLVAAALVGAGRFFVADNDALRAANERGIVEARVVERYNLFASRRGCVTGDAVAFTVAGLDGSGEHVEITVCCGTWFQGCTVR